MRKRAFDVMLRSWMWTLKSLLNYKLNFNFVLERMLANMNFELKFYCKAYNTLFTYFIQPMVKSYGSRWIYWKNFEG